MRRLEFTSFIPVPIEKAWEFFSSPANLSVITPPEMGFFITTPPAKEMYEGMIITYKVTPVARIRMNWVTEITRIKPMDFFVDEQRLGPYKIWHHEHHFRKVEGGVEMRDILFYHVGWGVFGKIADALFVKRRVMEIFSFREQKIRRLFPGN